MTTPADTPDNSLQQLYGRCLVMIMMVHVEDNSDFSVYNATDQQLREKYIELFPSYQNKVQYFAELNQLRDVVHDLITHCDIVKVPHKQIDLDQATRDELLVAERELQQQLSCHYEYMIKVANASTELNHIITTCQIAGIAFPPFDPTNMTLESLETKCDELNLLLAVQDPLLQKINYELYVGNAPDIARWFDD